MSIRHIKVIDEKHGKVALTQKELDFIVLVAEGLIVQSGNGSTAEAITDKITKATGWVGMRRTQLFCRFAYLHGLVRL